MKNRIALPSTYHYFSLPISLYCLLCIVGISQAVTAEQTCIPHDKWLLPATKKIVNTAELLPTFIDRRVILLGEHHANIMHHRWQLTMLQQLYKLNKNMLLGFEVFPRRLQKTLDQWVNKEINKKDFIATIDWDSIWGFDLSFYMPLFEFARKNDIPMYAMNVDKSLLKLVKKQGWQAVPSDLREGLSEPVKPLREYVQRLATSFNSHGITSENMDSFKRKFLRFVQQQLVWDVAMSDVIASVVKQNDTSLFVGIIGSWHLINRHGVPHQLSAKNINDSAVFVPWDDFLECSSITAEFADAIYGTTNETNAHNTKH